MARHTRIHTAQLMHQSGMVPVFYHSDLAFAQKLLKACYLAGVRAFEFTNRGDFAHEVFAGLSKFAKAELPELALGIGSVIDAGTTSLYLQLGADFVVSPMLVPEMAPVCNRRKVLWIPGCGSLSEIGQAHELGAEIVKIFPASAVGGPDFIRSVKGPCPWVSIMPTGGVAPTEENLEAWFQAGAACVGMGSKLFPKELMEQEDFAGIESRVRAVLMMVRKIRA